MLLNRTEIDFSKYGTIFIINPDTQYYIEFVNSLYRLFKSKNYNVVKSIGNYLIDNLNIKGGDLVILINSSLMYFMLDYNNNKELIDKIISIKCDYVLYQSEPRDIQDNYINDNKNIYDYLNPIEVWTYTHENLNNICPKM